MPGVRGMDRAGHDAADAGDRVGLLADRHHAGGRADDVDDVAQADARRRWRPSGRRARRPGSECPAAARAARPSAAQSVPAIRVRAARTARRARPRTPASSGSRPARKSSPGSPPSDSFHSHLWPIAQTLRGTSRRVGDAAQHGRDQVAVLQGGDEPRPLVRVGAQPVPELRPARTRTSTMPPHQSKRRKPRLAGGPGDLRPPRASRGGRTRGNSRRAAPGPRPPGRSWSRWCRSPRASISRPSMPAAAIACSVAAIERVMWSAWLCAAWSGIVRAAVHADSRPMPEPSRPRSLSTTETRTLCVPKSTPATMLMVSMPGRSSALDWLLGSAKA